MTKNNNNDMPVEVALIVIILVVSMVIGLPIDMFQKPEITITKDSIEVDFIEFSYTECGCTNMGETGDLICDKCGIRLKGEEYYLRWISKYPSVVVSKQDLTTEWLDENAECFAWCDLKGNCGREFDNSKTKSLCSKYKVGNYIISIE